MNCVKKDPNVNSVAGLIRSRFGVSPEEFLNDDREYDIVNLELIVDALHEAATSKTKVVFACDYDADGIDAGAIAKLLSCYAGIDYEVKIPRRFSEGFGLRKEYTETLRDCILVTADNGIAAIDAVAAAKANGLKVYVTDHHEPVMDENGELELPDADLIVNPHVNGGEFVEYCGAGIMYRIFKRYMEKYDNPVLNQGQKDYMLRAAETYAAMATICDAVPMVGENRSIVKKGLFHYNRALAEAGKAISQGGHPIPQIFRCLSNEFGHTKVSEGIIAFNEGPAINAPGRLDDEGSQKVYEAFSYIKMQPSSAVSNAAHEFKDINDTRKRLKSEALRRAEDIIDITEQYDKGIIVIEDDECLLGLVGIVAGDITEKYGVPSIVFTEHGENDIKGSGRSVEGVDLKALLDKHKNLIGERYGGHPMACGVTIDRSILDEMTEIFHSEIKKKPRNTDIEYDFEIAVSGIGNTFEDISKFGPFGEANPTPVVLIKNVKLDKNTVKFMKGGEYFKGKINETEYEVFGNSSLIAECPDIAEGAPFDIVCKLELSSFRDRNTIQLSPIAIEKVDRIQDIGEETDLER